MQQGLDSGMRVHGTEDPCPEMTLVLVPLTK